MIVVGVGAAGGGAGRALTVLVCWPVTIGTDVDTLMTAFLFSEVITCGFETMLTRFSEASALSIAKNSPAREGERRESAAGQGHEPADGRARARTRSARHRPERRRCACCPKRKRPCLSAQSTPSRSVVGERDLGDQHLDQHLARHAVELLDRGLDVHPLPGRRGHDDGVGHLVGDEAHLALGQRARRRSPSGPPGPTEGGGGGGGGGCRRAGRPGCRPWTSATRWSAVSRAPGRSRSASAPRSFDLAFSA